MIGVMQERTFVGICEQFCTAREQYDQAFVYMGCYGCQQIGRLSITNTLSSLHVWYSCQLLFQIYYTKIVKAYYP